MNYETALLEKHKLQHVHTYYMQYSYMHTVLNMNMRSGSNAVYVRFLITYTVLYSISGTETRHMPLVQPWQALYTVQYTAYSIYDFFLLNVLSL